MDRDKNIVRTLSELLSDEHFILIGNAPELIIFS